MYRGCQFPADYLYDVDRDVWVRLDDDGCVTMGMTDPAQAQCGKFVHVRFKAVGRYLLRGQSAATIESAKWVGPFPTPLSGEIVANNAAGYQQDILLANKDPYLAGWLIRLRPDKFEEERPALLVQEAAFDRYRDKLAAQDMQCYRCVE